MQLYVVTHQREEVFTQRFAAALVRPEVIALNAPALEPPLCVGTTLAAVTFYGTLVHIWRNPRAEAERRRNQRCSIQSCTGLMIQSGPRLNRSDLRGKHIHALKNRISFRIYLNNMYCTNHGN